MEDSTKKWLWGALGLAAGAGLAYMVFKGKQQEQQAAALPQGPGQVPIQNESAVPAMGQPPQPDPLVTGEPGSVPGGEPGLDSYSNNGEF